MVVHQTSSAVSQEFILECFEQWRTGAPEILRADLQGIRESTNRIIMALENTGQFPPPVIRNIPDLHNRYFEGRQTLLADVQAVLQTSDVVLSSAGGFGKTEVALEVCRRLRQRNIIWLDAASDGFLNESVLDTVKLLGV